MPGEKTTDALRAAVFRGLALGGSWSAMVGVVTTLHALRALAGHEAAAVRTLGGAMGMAALLCARGAAFGGGSIAARGMAILLLLVVGAMSLGAVLFGLDALLVQPARIGAGVAGALVSACGAALLVTTSHFAKPRATEAMARGA